MPKDQSENPRAAAQQRVRETFERQAARLDRAQEETRERDALAQVRSLDRAAKTMQELEENKREALKRHDRLWNEERRKFSPEAAPSFGLFGPPRRPEPRHYKALEQRFAQRREEITRQHDDRLNACQEQAERMREAFARASQAREQQHSQERERLFREQADSFERRVEADQARSERPGEEKSLSREFGRRSPDTGPDIAG